MNENHDNKIVVNFTGKLASDMVMCRLPLGAPVLDFYIRAESPTGKWFTVQASIFGERAHNYTHIQRGDIVHIEGIVGEPRSISRGGIDTPTYNISVLNLELCKEIEIP